MQPLTSTTYRDETWDFRSADTKQYTHGFHPYPAMMIPQIARRILEEFGQGAQQLFDPYCGTGTSLVEANLKGVDAIGTDINPLARLIAKVKTTVIPLEVIDQHIKDFNDFVFSIRWDRARPTPVIPRFKNIDYWFKEDTQYQLAVLKEYIEGIAHEDVRDFFSVAFSETVREVSLTRNGEFKLYRKTPRQIETFFPDAWAVMAKKLVRNRRGMAEYIRAKAPAAVARIYDFNTVYGIPQDVLGAESVDIIITSPPYGDSRTTVAYGQFSRLSNQWLGFEKLNEVDKKCMGGKRDKEIKTFDFPPLDAVLARIAALDPKRVHDVVAFYADYEASIHHVAGVVRQGGIVAYVVGNRRVKGIEIPTDKVTSEFFARCGFTHLKTVIRAIPNKRMPKRNSPSNVVGQTDTTMNREYIVILRKEG